jgi:hypothetical protein
MTQAKAIKATATKATVQVAELQHNGTEVSYADIWSFVQKHAGGNLHNVQIVPLANVQLDSESPVPFGYNGKRGGVRETIQNWMLNGVDGDCSLATVLGKAKPLGHSSKKPVCLHALLNGGYSPSSSVWGTGYVKLVVQPKAA